MKLVLGFVAGWVCGYVIGRVRRALALRRYEQPSATLDALHRAIYGRERGH